MAVAYDIKAHPTVYGGRQFRSRLEAKWAAFFDQSGWAFEYEPFDLDGWSPDFMLGDHTLVEVKPISAPDQDTINKMTAAAVRAKWPGELLLVGVAPLFDMQDGPYISCAIGWLGGREYTLDDELLFWFERASACISPNGKTDYAHAYGSYTGRIFGAHYKENDWPEDSRWLKERWDRAANLVQWHKQ